MLVKFREKDHLLSEVAFYLKRRTLMFSVDIENTKRKSKMANSKHAHIRYNILDYCFRNKALTFQKNLDFLNEE